MITKKILALLLLSFSLFSAEKVTILCLGDSLTAGFGLAKEEAFPDLLEEKFKKNGQKAKVINAGVSGNTSAGGLRRLNWYKKVNFDIVILALGANDGLRGLKISETEKNLEAIIIKLRKMKPEVKVILAGMQVPPNMGAQYTEDFRRIYPKLAKKLKIELVPFLLEGVAGKKGLNLADGIHPNTEGHKVIVQNIWQVMKGL